MSVQPTPLRSEATREESAWSAMSVPVLTLALQALNERVLLWVVVIGAGAIWTYAVIRPELLRLAGATLYSCTVLWPMLWRRRGEP